MNLSHVHLFLWIIITYEIKRIMSNTKFSYLISFWKCMKYLQLAIKQENKQKIKYNVLMWPSTKIIAHIPHKSVKGAVTFDLNLTYGPTGNSLKNLLAWINLFIRNQYLEKCSLYDPISKLPPAFQLTNHYGCVSWK